MKLVGFVYKWINLIDGMWYLGSHDGKRKDYIGSGTRFYRAYKKHGPDSFKRFILYRGEDFREKEDYLLKLWDAAGDPMSYNLKNEAWGGRGGGFTLSEERKRNHSIIMKGKPSSFKGKSHTKESIEKNRQAHLGKTAWNKGLKGCYTNSKEVKLKKSNSGKLAWQDPDKRANILNGR